jgi:hypothetical protein
VYERVSFLARPKGALNKVNATAKSIALAALSSVEQVELWRKHLINEDPRVSIAALTYLTDRVAGKPSRVVKGCPDNPISITLEWTSRPEWLPNVTLNQQVTHIHAADVGVEDGRRVHKLRSDEG